MRRMIPVYVTLILLVIMAMANQALACTIFYTKGSSTHYFASNEDWTLTNPVILVQTGDKNNYSYMVFGWDSYLPSYPQGGLNEHGVCLDWAALSSQQFTADPKRKEAKEDIMVLILKKCKSVNEVIKLVNTYNWPQFASEHLLVADRSGNSCVIEWSDGDYIFLPKNHDYQAITNFALHNHSIGWYPCKRFQTADNYLKKNTKTKIGLAEVRNLLSETHQESNTPTIYSYIIDTKTLDVIVYFNHDYSKPLRYNFFEEIKKGKHRIKLY